MLKTILTTSLVALVYLCLFVIFFSPSIYAFWIYLVGRKVKFKKTGRMLRTALTALMVNILVVCVLVHAAFNFVVPKKVADMEKLIDHSITNAKAAQEKFFAANGRYYSLGPVRGPFKDAYGAAVEENVVVQVEPVWKVGEPKESFQAYAVHMWTDKVLAASTDSNGPQVVTDPELQAKIRSRLIHSVK